MKTGLDHVIATAKAFGFSTPLTPYPSLALGSSEVIPLELARAYSALADGLLPWPMSLRDVAAESGEILERRSRLRQRIRPGGALPRLWLPWS